MAGERHLDHPELGQKPFFVQRVEGPPAQGLEQRHLLRSIPAARQGQESGQTDLRILLGQGLLGPGGHRLRFQRNPSGLAQQRIG